MSFTSFSKHIDPTAMDYLPQLLALSGIILLACASPGPDFVAVTSHSLSERRSGVFVGLGITCAVAIWASLAVFGFGLLIQQFFWLYEGIRLAGAAYLIYLGVRMLAGALRARAGTQDIAQAPPLRAGQAWRRGFLVGITNPKTATFFATLFVTLLPVGAPSWVYAAVVAVVFCITGTWMCLLASFFSVGVVRSVYARIRKPVDALMGAALVGLGVRMATSR
ncbi:LysE family transporter [Cupriavidus basilensis]|uniref:LysE family transporter n=1 Tax=Cupriavidus basilensis TaxID=68895 RepID=A0ABT6B5H4_9BURK|nr:LysE family transporter [Cupriavidus basilensis]MDF3839727.1 LysE family transporter [Cupriavidus basilensis]